MFNGGLRLRDVERHGRLQRTSTLKPYLLGVFSHIRSGFILFKNDFLGLKFLYSTKSRYLCNPFQRTWRNGSRARLRIWCREAWGFESLRPHNFPYRISLFLRYPVYFSLYQRKIDISMRVCGKSVDLGISSFKTPQHLV